jgi:hypothetical protein
MDTEDEIAYYDIPFEVTSPARELARLRDELKLKLHLAQADARSQWEELETKWVLLQSRLTALKLARDQSAHDVGTALKQLMAELGQGYQRLQEAFRRL